MRKTPSSSSAAKMAVLAECVLEKETADSSDDEADTAAALDVKIGFMIDAVGV